MTHLSRAQPTMQPAMVFDPPLEEVPAPPEPDQHQHVFRYPDWIHELVKEAAKKETLSVNQWVTRVIAEQAQRSKMFGWQTSPPTRAPDHDARVSLGGRARITEAIATKGTLTLQSGTYPTPENTVTWTRLATDEGYSAEFEPPDDDIPSLL